MAIARAISREALRQLAPCHIERARCLLNHGFRVAAQIGDDRIGLLGPHALGERIRGQPGQCRQIGNPLAKAGIGFP